MRQWQFIHNHETEQILTAESVTDAKKQADALTKGRDWGAWRSLGDGDYVKGDPGDNFVYLIYKGKIEATHGNDPD